jgi:hypothetical protein
MASSKTTGPAPEWLGEAVRQRYAISANCVLEIMTDSPQKGSDADGDIRASRQISAKNGWARQSPSRFPIASFSQNPQGG